MSDLSVLAAVPSKRVPSSIRPLIGLIWSLPLLWALGGDRLFFPVIVLVALTSKALSQPRGSLRMTRPLWWLFTFLVISFVSISQISEVSRIITFVWDYLIFASFFMTILFVTKNVNDYSEFRRLLFHILAFSLFSQLIAISYFVFGSWKYNSIIGELLPAGFSDTMTGRNVLLRAVGKELYLLGLSERLKSIYSSAIHFGAVLMLSVSIAMFFIFTSRGWKKIMYLVVAASSVTLLVYSQSRTAIALTAIMIPAILIAGTLARSRLFNTTTATLVAGISLLGISALAALLWPEVSALVQDVFVESRASSFDSRSEIYIKTLRWLMVNPLFGYGTQVDVPGLSYPLGSHNWYLGIWFKHGAIALLCFIGFAYFLARSAIKNMFKDYVVAGSKFMAISLGVWAIGYLALCMTIEPIVDAIHVFLAGCVFGIILSTPKLMRNGSDRGPLLR